MDLCNRNDIQALLQRHGFRFSKAMGQNFLIQGWVPRDIAAACGADQHTGVLEIGPGIGPLTRELAQRAGKVVSVELDRRLYPVLEETMADFPNFTLIRGRRDAAGAACLGAGAPWGPAAHSVRQPAV